MFHRNLSFFFVEALKNIRTNFYLHLTIILIISISFFVFGIILIFETNIENILSSVSENLTLEIFLKDQIKAGSGDFFKLKRFLHNYPLVKTIRYIPRSQAYFDFRKNFKQYNNILTELGENPFPASFRISLKQGSNNKEDLINLISILHKWDSVEDLSLNKEWVNHFYSFVSLVRISVWFLISLITSGMILIVYNGIKLTINSKSSQIEIMKLVGATNWFIRGQFIFEGILEGLIGASLSLLLLFLTYQLLFEKITDAFSFLFPQHSFSFLPDEYIFIILISGTILGLLGAVLSTSKFLKNIYG